MDRLKLWLLPIYAVVGFIAIVLIVPNSRWVVLRQLDVMAGWWRYMGGPADGRFTDIPYVFPIQRGLDERDPSNDETARFLRLVAPSEFSNAPDAYDQRFIDLYEICKKRNDAKSWAQFIRVAAFQAQIKPPKLRQNEMPDHRAAQTCVRDACFAGQRLDPGNAFFPMMLSGVLNRLGDLKSSRAAFIQASDSPRYDDYVLFEPESRYAYLVSHYGERGHQLKAFIYADIFLQHLSVIHSLGLAFTDPSDVEGRLAAIRLGSLIMLNDKSAIGVIVARKLVTAGLKPARDIGSNSILADSEVRTLARDLEVKIGHSIDVAKIVNTYSSIQSNPPKWPDDPDSIREIVNLRPAFSAWSLGALLFLPFALWFVSLKARSSKLAAASPYLVWLIAVSSDAVYGANPKAPAALAVAALLFIPAIFVESFKFTDRVGMVFIVAALWASGGKYPMDGFGLVGHITTLIGIACFIIIPIIFPKAHRAVGVFGFAIALFSIWLSWTSPAPLTPAILFAVSLAFERRVKEIPAYATVVGVIVACIGSSAVWVIVASKLGFGSAALLGSLAAIGFAAAVPARAPVKWLPVAGASCLIIGVWFGVMVAQDLEVDKRMVVISDWLLHDADDLRQPH